MSDETKTCPTTARRVWVEENRAERKAAMDRARSMTMTLIDARRMNVCRVCFCRMDGPPRGARPEEYYAVVRNETEHAHADCVGVDPDTAKALVDCMSTKYADGASCPNGDGGVLNLVPDLRTHLTCSKCYRYFPWNGMNTPAFSADAPIVTNKAGGSQSAIPFRCDLLPPEAVLQVAKVLARGAEKYTPNNWRKIPQGDHLNHALAHVFAYQTGDRQEDHLSHAACRLLFALETTDFEEAAP